MTLKAVQDPMSYLSRIALLGCLRKDVDALEASLSPEITGSSISAGGAQRPTGVSESNQLLPATQVTLADRSGSFQVMVFGLKVILHRIELDTMDKSSSTHVVSTVYESAMKTASESVTLIENLTVADRLMFWMPCESSPPSRRPWISCID